MDTFAQAPPSQNAGMPPKEQGNNVAPPASAQTPSTPQATPAMASSPPQPKEPGLLDELWGKRKYILKAFALLLVFWLLEFAIQYYSVSPNDLESSLVRSFALGGTTLIAVALLIGPVSVLFPKFNYNDYRRAIGVGGFTLVVMHILAAILTLFNGDPLLVFWSLNPFENPVLFGSLAFPIFALMFVTSTDWATDKLGYKNWKTVHRLAYVGYLFVILHFTQVNPDLLYTLPGYVLIAVTFAALVLELAAFVKKIRSKPQLQLGAWVGFGLILVYAILLSIAFFFRGLVA